MGMAKLIERIRDASMAEAFDGLFPRDDPANTRFAINFFTSIGKRLKKSKDATS
jgi:pre-mRNA-splicing factor CWC22